MIDSSRVFGRRRLALAGLAILAGAPAVAASTGVILRQEPSPGPNSEIGTTRIVVDGPNNRGYTEVTTSQVDIWAAVAVQKGPNVLPYHKIVIASEGASADAEATAATRRYKLSFPYVAPLSGVVQNQRISPVARCNAALADARGPAREAFLTKGTRLTARNAYRMTATATYTQPGEKPKRRKIFPDPPTIGRDVDTVTNAFADAEIECRALERPRPRTESGTQGPPPRPGQKMEPTIKSVSLRMEPASREMVGGQLCPTVLRLVGHVETRRAFRGQAIIFGPGYLSPITPLNLSGAGNRSFVATYPLKWDQPRGLAAGPDNRPRRQTVALKLNIANDENKVLETATATEAVSCAPPR